MRLLKTFAILLVIGVPACRSRPQTEAIEDPGSVTIRIINDNRLDVVLYLVHDAHRERIGDVVSNTTRNFELKLRTLGAGHEFTLLADPVGSLEPINSELVHAQDGQVIIWTLESDFARSHLQIQ